MFILFCYCFSSSLRLVVEQLVCICLYTGSTCLKQFASCGTNVEFIGIILFSRSWRLARHFGIIISSFPTQKSQMIPYNDYVSKLPIHVGQFNKVGVARQKIHAILGEIDMVM